MDEIATVRSQPLHNKSQITEDYIDLAYAYWPGTATSFQKLVKYMLTKRV